MSDEIDLFKKFQDEKIDLTLKSQMSNDNMTGEK